MNTIQFLAEWAVRSSLLIGIAAVALWALRVKDSSIRLAAWTAALAGSLLIPVMSASLPTVPVHVTHVAQAIAPISVEPVAQSFTPIVHQQAPRSQPFDWMAAAFILYAAIALAMLLRLGVGLLGSLRLLHQSKATERDNIRESERIAAPVTLGILRPSIVLPPDWREWDRAKLDAVIAHERSHIERRDPLVQVASALHRALLWFSPLSWFLHSRIVRTAEEASDDAGVSAIQDRASYAELLLDFVQRGVRARSGAAMGVPMARYGRADQRIHRILDSTALSHGVTKRAVVTIALIGIPLSYLVATAKAQSPSAPAAPVTQKPVPGATFQPKAVAPKPLQSKSASTSGDLEGLGTVSASTVTIRPQLEGRLVSLNFKEGQAVKAGDVLGKLADTGLDADLQHAQSTLDLYETKVAVAQDRYNSGTLSIEQLRMAQGALENARGALDEVQLRVASNEILSPISGVAGLRLVEPGNTVHPGDPIVVIAQFQPINVVFTIPQDLLPKIRKRLNTGDIPVVEAWSRDEKTKIATGTLTATDNQIDEQTGTIKLKATFDNKDSALFPNQFVNVRLKTR